jgi:hypothetical protein
MSSQKRVPPEINVKSGNLSLDKHARMASVVKLQ